MNREKPRSIIHSKFLLFLLIPLLTLFSAPSLSLATTLNCSYILTPASPQAFTASDGEGGVAVDASDAFCAWTAVSHDSWIIITSGESGTGDGSVVYTVIANTGVARTGTMTIAGETYTVNQDSEIPSGNALYLRSNTTPGSTIFADESGAGHAINRYGDTKHVTFGNNTAIRFDGNGDYLKTPASSDWNFGTGNFTIDLWVYFTSTPDNFDGIFSTYTQSGVLGGYLMQVANGTIQWYGPGSTGWMNTGVAPVVGVWTHLAAVRSGNMITIYVDGVDRVHQDCTGRSFNSLSDGLVFGRLYTLKNSNYFGGYMDEVRVTKGGALWTGDFTPPNNPGAQDTDTDRISDTLEAGTYLTDPNVVDTDDDGIDDGDELDYWGANWNTDYDGDAATYANNLLDPDSDNDGLNDGDEVNTYGSDPSAADTDGDGLNDGLEVNTYGTDYLAADSDDDGIDDGDEVTYWGAHPTAGWDSDSDLDGVINLLDQDSDNDKYSDGEEMDAATDPADPNSFPVMPAGNALYLRSATTNNSVVFLDESGAGHGITPYGNAKHATFGTDTAIQFDGDGDYLKTPASSDYDFGSGDFTIDLWVYFSSTPDNFDGIFSTYKQSGATGGYLMQVTGGTIQWYAPGATGWLNTGVVPAVGKWTHLAVVRSGNMIAIYVNGVDRVHKTCTGLTFNSSNDGMVLGRLYTSKTGYYLNGYIDEMRVTKGYGLWTEKFTPPNPPEPDVQFTILHTSDVHHHASGYGPYLDYTPNGASDDGVLGGYARMATVIGGIKATQAVAGIPTLLVDSGDYFMGATYDMTATNPIALQFFQAMGYDAVTLGNHEFDWAPQGLAMLLTNGKTNGFTVPVVSSNMQINGNAFMTAMFGNGTIVNKKIITLSNGIKIGLLGLMGPGAETDAPARAPVTFNHNASFIQPLVNGLVKTDNVNLVVALSHGGVENDGTGDDAVLAQNVTGIDVIASGHYHTAAAAPANVNGALIISPGSYGRYVGRLDITYNAALDMILSSSYNLIPIDDTVAGNPAIQGMVDAYDHALDATLSAALGLQLDTPISGTGFALEKADYQVTGIGSLCADSLRNVANGVLPLNPDLGQPFQIGVIGSGTIRDAIYPGNTGAITFSDAYNTLPLGASPYDPSLPGYPLMSVYATGAEIYTICAVGMTLSHMYGADFFLNFSGLQIDYNPALAGTPPTFGVQAVRVYSPTDLLCLGTAGGQPAPTIINPADPTTLYRIAVGLYELQMMNVISALLPPPGIQPKKADGSLLLPADYADARIDASAAAGVQELKEWLALVQYLGEFGGLLPPPYAPGGAATGDLRVDYLP